MHILSVFYKNNNAVKALLSNKGAIDTSQGQRFWISFAKWKNRLSDSLFSPALGLWSGAGESISKRLMATQGIALGWHVLGLRP